MHKLVFGLHLISIRRTVMTATASLAVFGASATWCETASFDRDSVGTPPNGWSCGVTGRGAPKWSVEAEAGAPSPPNVLKQWDRERSHGVSCKAPGPSPDGLPGHN